MRRDAGRQYTVTGVPIVIGLHFLLGLEQASKVSQACKLPTSMEVSSGLSPAACSYEACDVVKHCKARVLQLLTSAGFKEKLEVCNRHLFTAPQRSGRSCDEDSV